MSNNLFNTGIFVKANNPRYDNKKKDLNHDEVGLNCVFSAWLMIKRMLAQLLALGVFQL